MGGAQAWDNVPKIACSFTRPINHNACGMNRVDQYCLCLLFNGLIAISDLVLQLLVKNAATKKRFTVRSKSEALMNP